MKTFKLSWGSVVVVEQAQSTSDHKKPTIQLLHFTDGECEGQNQLRFCQYSPNGAFSRFPLSIGPTDLTRLRREIKKCPQLHKLLARLV